jgi:ankyrin repeat protein
MELHNFMVSFSTHRHKLIQDGRTALTCAAAEGHSSVVKVLLDAKADVNHADNVRHSLCIQGWKTAFR